MNNPFTLYSRRRSGAKLSRLDRIIVFTLRWTHTLFAYGVILPLVYVGTSLLSLIMGVALIDFILLLGALVVATGTGILITGVVLLIISLIVAPFYNHDR